MRSGLYFNYFICRLELASVPLQNIYVMIQQTR